ncbi:hypothetical protein [Spirosoma pollinicola]|uniref:hypothetical protein n=1 Tax=Spirosoma pollinicola TaxID=2057025 RepID=UPI0012FD7E5A|nr:hypothetical protein [Spirosoma pollinicola]
MANQTPEQVFKGKDRSTNRVKITNNKQFRYSIKWSGLRGAVCEDVQRWPTLHWLNTVKGNFKMLLEFLSSIFQQVQTLATRVSVLALQNVKTICASVNIILS